MACDEEFEEGWRNLDRCGWKVDMIVSHCCPSSIQREICGDRCGSDALTEYFGMIDAGDYLVFIIES